MKYCKTQAGQLAFKQRSVQLSPRQRAAFILFDGTRSAADIIVATQGIGLVAADVDRLVELGFITPVAMPQPAAAEPVPASAPTGAATGMSAHQQLYQLAYPLATQLTASLGLRGFRLNLAVEAASGYDDLVELYPKIEAAVGPAKCSALSRALGLRELRSG